MTNKTKLSHRIIAMLLVFTFLPSLFPVNYVFASNNGPTAPEAASFEAVDATDMVNLVTGDMSYVMPLLNVPSPEGGYPLSLSYHAGIAADQEASMVGLGWNLNPGAINRSVNGFPDDWGATAYNELTYDEGGADDYYSFSIGGTLPNGITLGVSKSWGANRAWGGTVGYAGVTTNFGSEGVNVGVGLNAGPLSLNLSQDGVGISASYSSGQSGYSASVGYNTGSNNLSIVGSSKQLASGVSLSSQNGFSNSIGGYSNSSQTLSSSSNSDYYTNTISKGFGINVGFFWAKYQHTRYEYSLFLNNRYKINGSLNPYTVLETNNDYMQNMNSLMDVKEFYVAGDDISRSTVSDPSSKNLETFIFPNYDNYSVHAQGLSADMSPRYFEEVTLFNKGKHEVNIPNSPYYPTKTVDFNYLVNPTLDYSEYSLGNRLNFYLNNTNSSFLRVSSGDFTGLGITENSNTSTDINIGNNQTALLNYNTLNNPTFSSSLTVDGFAKKSGNRKRDGTFVESFTNQQILNGDAGIDFIEAKGLNRDDLADLQEGIGAFRITTLDGKTYHYSLPVLHFESFDKNFEEITERDKKFFESRKLEPFATHWLLTAVTGPDYVDVNLDGKFDDKDYGYWVELEYGKWSDGYAWRTPKTGYKAVPHPYLIDPDTGEDKIEGYKFFWGRKQVYYLDKVKTRTHTALFVKSLRDDNQSANITDFNQFYNGINNFDPTINSKLFPDREEVIFTSAESAPILYDNEGNEILVSNNAGFRGKKRYSKYIYAPENRTLKLDRIILIKNKYDITDKSSGNLIENTAGSYSFNDGYYDVISRVSGASFPDLYYNLNVVSSFSGQLHQNVLDSSDLILSNNAIQGNAEKIVNFNYDYSLGKNTPNSSALSNGRLTLERVQFSGKRGLSLMPPYKFEYEKNWVEYNFENQDVWGYVNEHPEAWSLNKIITPTGSSINISYESDSFYDEAAFGSGTTEKYSYLRDIPGNEGFTINESQYLNNITDVQKDGDEITLFFDTSNTSNLSDILLLNGELDLRFVNRLDTPNFFNTNVIDHNYSNGNNTYEIVEINQNQSIRLRVNESTNLEEHERLSSINCPSDGNLPANSNECLVLIEFYIRNGLFTDNNPNGKLGGGIRVSSISIGDADKEFKTTYDYMDPMRNRISGITSYEPSDKPKAIPYAEELPAPNVMYEYVTVNNLDSNDETIQKSRYHHEVLQPFNLNPQEEFQYNLGSAFKVAKEQKIGSGGTRDKVFKYTLYDNLSILGRLKSVRVFNGLDHQLSATINRFKSFTDDDQSQGVVQESFKSYSRYSVISNSPTSGTTTDLYYNLNSSSKTEFPSVLKSITNIQGGVSQSRYFEKHDFLTGLPTETVVEKNGTKYKTEIVPAYIKYGSMGSKSDNNGYANMLSQEAMQKSFVLKNGQYKPIGAGITTWNEYLYGAQSDAGNLLKNYNIHRKEKTYVWNGTTNDDGIFTDFTGDDDGFQWGPLVNDQPEDSQWKLISKITKYDPFSMVLEIEDINENRVSTKMGDNNTKIFSVGNAGYDEMYFSGAEDLNGNSYGGDILKGTSTPTSDAHTGNHALSIASGQSGYIVNVEHKSSVAKPYKISLWTKASDVDKVVLNIGNGTIGPKEQEKVPAGEWVQLNFYTSLANDSQVYVTSNNGTVVVDDFRLHPSSSNITSYVYNDWDELTHIIGPNNMAIEYQYDALGRLVKTLTEVANYNNDPTTGGFKKTSENQYTYKY